MNCARATFNWPVLQNRHCGRTPKDLQTSRANDAVQHRQILDCGLALRRESEGVILTKIKALLAKLHF